MFVLMKKVMDGMRELPFLTEQVNEKI